MFLPKFDNTFITQLPGDFLKENYTRQVKNAAFSFVNPVQVPNPRLVAFSEGVADILDIPIEEFKKPYFVEVLTGNKLIKGMKTYATNYGGHQFGHWAGQLGDGRAINLGEIINHRNERWEVQLKGAGPTPYSRHADGRAVLRSSIREFLCSEAMHYLGVPTTRALSLALTGNNVTRDIMYDGNKKKEPGAIVTRVSPSFTRFGNFELPASREELDLLSKLVKFTIKRDFSDLRYKHLKNEEIFLNWFRLVCDKTAHLIAKWMMFGFVHGVMNTDNMSILGLTIDYGPYGWLDNYDPFWTPNTTDSETKRYTYIKQPEIGLWNLIKLANAIYPIVRNEKGIQSCLDSFISNYENKNKENFSNKMGISFNEELTNELFELLYDLELDFTIFFKLLESLDLTKPQIEHFEKSFYNNDKVLQNKERFSNWLLKYVSIVKNDSFSTTKRKKIMNNSNPYFILRNYLSQEAIEYAEKGDFNRIRNLLLVSKKPFDKNNKFLNFYKKRPEWAKNKIGSSRLSCSS